jgi:hypothetical protein
MKNIQAGLYVNGSMVEAMGSKIRATRLNVLIMNAVMGLMDAEYQKQKERFKIADNSYMAFDYMD